MRVLLLLSLALATTVEAYAADLSATASKGVRATETQAPEAQSTGTPAAQTHDTAHQRLMEFLQAQAHSQAAHASQARVAAAARAAQARTVASPQRRAGVLNAGTSAGGTRFGATATRNPIGSAGSGGTVVASHAATSTAAAQNPGRNPSLRTALVPSAPTTRRLASINGTNVHVRKPF